MNASMAYRRVSSAVSLFSLLMAGCVCCHDPLPNPCDTCIDPICDPCNHMVAQIEYPDAERCDQSLTLGSGPPRKLSDGAPTDFWDISLDDAIRMALDNSRVLKDLGGQVLSSPQAVRTIYDPSITISNPVTGEEAALAAFDSQYQSSFLGTASNQAFNNATLGGGATTVNSDGFSWTQQISKTAATGTQFSLARLLQYENSDAPFNLFPSSYSGALQGTVRHPLLQGSGVGFNRIAGASGQIGSRGVILARIDGDISIAQFEQGVRDFVQDVETAYWRLYVSYRQLDSVRTGRDLSRKTWQTVHARYEADLTGGAADQEAQAREQLYEFEQELLSSLNSGLYQTERNLRRMLGLPVSDSRLLRPADEPIDTKVSYDWHDCLTDALVRRVELRTQMWRVKQRELELIAAKNFLLPRLDAVASYRIDGFGDSLFGGSGNFSNLADELSSLDFNQAQAGLQFSMPLGFRRELAGVRHAKLNLCRERAVLQDQEHLVSHNLGEAFVAVETAYETIQLTRERMRAAEQVVGARQALFETGRVQINVLLESQRRLTDAQIDYFTARTSYASAISSLHFQKGTLLPFNGVRLQEGPWPSEACEQAWYERRRFMGEPHCDKETVPYPVSLGPYSTQIADVPQPQPSPAIVDEEQIVVEPTMEWEMEIEEPEVIQRLPEAENIEDGFHVAVPADEHPPIDRSSDVKPERLPRLEEWRPEPTPSTGKSNDPFRDAPGPGQVDPASPGPADFIPAVEADLEAARRRSESATQATSYVQQLLQGAGMPSSEATAQ
jgi:outer membrane protein TolC